MTYRDEFKSGQRYFFWTLPRVAVGVMAIIVVVFFIAVATTPLTIGFGWYKGEANLRSFDHVKATYQVAFDDANAMDANARQACRFKKQVDEAKASGDETAANQRQSQLLAVETNYDRIKGEYDAYMSDHFRGGVIKPQQLPMPYPTLEVRMTAVCMS